MHVCVWPHVPRASTDDSDKELQACAGLWIEVNMPSKDAQNKQQRVFITVAQLKAMCERPEWTSKVSLFRCYALLNYFLHADMRISVSSIYYIHFLLQ